MLWPVTNLRTLVVIRRHDNQAALTTSMAGGYFYASVHSSLIPMVTIAKIFGELLGVDADLAEHYRRHICPICYKQVNYPATTKITIWSNTQTHCNGPKGIWCGSNGFIIFKTNRDAALKRRLTHAMHIRSTPANN